MNGQTCVRSAFTLLEMMIVVIVLGILAALVIPKFASATDDARTASVQSTVGGVRASIAAFRTRAVIEGSDPFPTLAQLETIGVVVQHEIGVNPFTNIGGVQSVSRAQAEARAVVSEGSAGWNYFVDNASSPPVAIFYANSDDATTSDDGSGGFLGANEL